MVEKKQKCNYLTLDPDQKLIRIRAFVKMVMPSGKRPRPPRSRASYNATYRYGHQVGHSKTLRGGFHQSITCTRYNKHVKDHQATSNIITSAQNFSSCHQLEGATLQTHKNSHRSGSTLLLSLVNIDLQAYQRDALYSHGDVGRGTGDILYE